VSKYLDRIAHLFYNNTDTASALVVLWTLTIELPFLYSSLVPRKPQGAAWFISAGRLVTPAPSRPFPSLEPGIQLKNNSLILDEETNEEE
jgi:hypothetical protein